MSTSERKRRENSTVSSVSHHLAGALKIYSFRSSIDSISHDPLCRLKKVNMKEDR